MTNGLFHIFISLCVSTCQTPKPVIKWRLLSLTAGEYHKNPLGEIKGQCLRIFRSSAGLQIRWDLGWKTVHDLWAAKTLVGLLTEEKETCVLNFLVLGEHNSMHLNVTQVWSAKGRKQNIWIYLFLMLLSLSNKMENMRQCFPLLQYIYISGRCMRIYS